MYLRDSSVCYAFLEKRTAGFDYWSVSVCYAFDVTPSFKNSRYKNGYNQNLFHLALRRSLQGVAERPLPCNYNVIQPISALSRR